jgi:threonine/homoserine/homoserine lactone efflux protein
MQFLHFIIGMLVGIYGYMMPGYINLSVFQLGMQVHKKALYQVLFIIAVIEFPYCFLSMSGMKWLMEQDLILLILKWLIVVVLFIVAFISLLTAKKKPASKSISSEKLDRKQINELIIFAILNPFQLSAWVIWGAYFIEKKWFSWTPFSISIFSLGATIGVAIILYVYAISGKKVINYFSLYRMQIDYGISGILFLLAIVQLVRNLM